MGEEDSLRNPEKVRAMFGAIAPRYDLANHLLSLNVDRRWRKLTVRRIVSCLGRQDFDVLDLACGTGDLTLALRGATNGRVVVMDFCHPMLVRGKEKLNGIQPRGFTALAEGDGMQLPLRESMFDAVTIAFGLRNFEDYERGLREMYRVLRPQGVLGVLEFSRPQAPFLRSVYRFYFSKLLPRFGTWVSGVSGPYSYLPDSVSKFPSPEDFSQLMRTIGFSAVEYLNLSGGIAVLYLGRKEKN